MTGEKDPRDVMQAEHDARLSEHPAFQAPAEMPGVEEIARALHDDLYPPEEARSPADQEKHWLSTAAHYREQAQVVLDLFAPILAEKERLARCWEKECEDRTAIAKMALDRALAAEAALAKAIVFELGEHHYVESRGDGTWAIKNGGCVLNVDGVWEWEPSSSNRTDEFIARTRFDREDAFRRAAAIRAQGE